MIKSEYLIKFLISMTILVSCKEKDSNNSAIEKELLPKSSQSTSIEDMLKAKGFSKSNQTDFALLKADMTQWNENTIIRKIGISRLTEEKNSHDWIKIKSGVLYNVKNKIKPGAFVQIFSLSPELPPLTLKVTNNEIDKGNGMYYVELEEIRNSDYWTYVGPKKWSQNSPVKLIAIYPPVENIKPLPHNNLTLENMPNNVSNDIIQIAFDLNNDNLPEVILCEFDCKNRSPQPEDYTCTETYLKKGNKWEMIDSSKPQ